MEKIHFKYQLVRLIGGLCVSLSLAVTITSRLFIKKPIEVIFTSEWADKAYYKCEHSERDDDIAEWVTIFVFALLFLSFGYFAITMTLDLGVKALIIGGEMWRFITSLLQF